MAGVQINVKQCSGCPFREIHTDVTVWYSGCWLQSFRFLWSEAEVEPEEPPDWCPLRQGPCTVTLISKQ